MLSAMRVKSPFSQRAWLALIWFVVIEVLASLLVCLLAVFGRK
jgi:hypothetical protein